jgi:hypothetical protein
MAVVVRVWASRDLQHFCAFNKRNQLVRINITALLAGKIRLSDAA